MPVEQPNNKSQKKRINKPGITQLKKIPSPQNAAVSLKKQHIFKSRSRPKATVWGI